MSTPTWLATLTALGTTAVLAAVAPLLSTGCSALECAEGTIEENGSCVPADSDPSSANCGDGTVLGDDGTCHSELDPTICGDNTTPDNTTMPGVTICVGTGGSSNCESSLPCPSASPNKVSVCGRFYDIETDTQIRAAVPNVANCGEGGATDGPCAMAIRFFDAIDFAGNPSTAAPLVPEELRVDDCGRYVARNIPRPSLGYLGIGVDDAAAPGTGDWELTGVAFPVASQQVRGGQKTYVLGASTNADWAADVGFAADNTFVDRGVYMAVFLHGTTPVAGVTVTGANGAARPNDDYYFSDTEPFTRSQVVAAGPTGPNGAAMLLNSGLVEHSGTGAEPSGCRWPSALAASIAGVMFFNPRVAEVNATTECP